MRTYILNLSDSGSVKLVNHFTYFELSIICTIPVDTEYLKVVGTIDFDKVWFDKKFYSAFGGNVEVFDLSELKSSSSYHSLRLSLNDGSKNYYGQNLRIKELILPNELESMPMIRNLPELRRIVGLGLDSFNNECRMDYYGSSNLSFCPKLEEIVFGSNIKILSIRNSHIKKIHIPDNNGSLQLEPYALAYNKKLEEIHIPRDMKELPEISYELILEKITRKVEELDIEAIIDSYQTTSSYESYKWSDTERERYTIDRDAKYTDEYLARLLPPIHEHHDDSTACVVKNNYNINPNKRYDFESCLSTFGKQGRNIFGPYHRTGNILRDIDNLKNKDEDVRKEARRKYNKKDHIDFLVNCRLSELINKKLEIESVLHIRQAENEFMLKVKGRH